MKKIIIIAGPNGAGKTTFAREYLPNEANMADTTFQKPPYAADSNLASIIFKPYTNH